MLFGRKKKNEKDVIAESVIETLNSMSDSEEGLIKEEKKEAAPEKSQAPVSPKTPPPQKPDLVPKHESAASKNDVETEEAQKVSVSSGSGMPGKAEELAAKPAPGSFGMGEGYTKEEDILAVLAQQLGMEYVNLNTLEPDPELIYLLSSQVAQTYKIFPLYKEDGALTVAMVDPTNITTLDALSLLLNMPVKGAIANEDDIMDLIFQFYGEEGETVDDMLEELKEEDFDFSATEEDFGDLERIANEAPIVKLVNLLLLQAIKDRASDLHVEPYQDSFRIRYRVDGTLHETIPPPKRLQLAIVSRLKVMANMNIAERRVPQDGRIKLSMADREIDLRVSSIPTINGESMVMRILDKSMMMIGLDQIGLMSEVQQKMEKIITRPNGIVLVTGPTGSGKTTTLYAALNKVYSPMLKIITTEEPVEYQMDGVVQCNINERVGLTFAACLRSILRQDPDVIMVGEIRDFETAAISIESALTGHLVFSTLHTNDAPSTVTRLIDMNIEPFLLTSTIEGVLAQRLVRTICSACREKHDPNPESLDEMGISQAEASQIDFYHGKGCAECNYTGYRGRIGIFELFTPSEETKEMILRRCSSTELRDSARKEGMKTLREDGWEKIINGITTVDEILKETI